MNSVLSFLKRSGFYLTIIGGIITIGAGYYFSMGMFNVSEVPMWDETILTPPPAESTSYVAGSATAKPSVSPSSKPALASATLAESTQKPANQAALDDANTEPTPKADTKKLPEKIISPVEGDIIVGYSGDTLVYSKTLGDWRIHSGIDIKVPLTTPVKCAFDGVIEKIYTDDALGITIIIDHQNTMKTVYANLSIDSMVKEGQKVAQGDIISGVGDTATFETGEVGHLHFEVLINAQHINPEDWIIK